MLLYRGLYIEDVHDMHVAEWALVPTRIALKILLRCLLRCHRKIKHDVSTPESYLIPNGRLCFWYADHVEFYSLRRSFEVGWPLLSRCRPRIYYTHVSSADILALDPHQPREVGWEYLSLELIRETHLLGKLGWGSMNYDRDRLGKTDGT